MSEGEKLGGRKRVAIATLAVVLLAGCALAAWRAYLAGAFLPAWAPWHERDEAIELGGDAEARIVLANKTLTISQNDVELYRSPGDWLASDVRAGDIDRDGESEILILFWRRGTYGTSHPFWEENDANFSQHLAVLKMQDGMLKNTWTASKIGVDVAFMKLDEAGQLVTISPEGELTTWTWGEWGFEVA